MKYIVFWILISYHYGLAHWEQNQFGIYERQKNEMISVDTLKREFPNEATALYFIGESHKYKQWYRLDGKENDYQFIDTIWMDRYPAEHLALRFYYYCSEYEIFEPSHWDWIVFLADHLHEYDFTVTANQHLEDCMKPFINVMNDSIRAAKADSCERVCYPNFNPPKK